MFLLRNGVNAKFALALAAITGQSVTGCWFYRLTALAEEAKDSKNVRLRPIDRPRRKDRRKCILLTSHLMGLVLCSGKNKIRSIDFSFLRIM